MDADLPTPDRVDLGPHEVDDEAVTGDEGIAARDSGGEPESVIPADGAAAAEQPAPGAEADASVEDDRLDLDAISADLEGVEAALARLSEGTYWTDEVTGEPLPDELLAARPTARRA